MAGQDQGARKASPPQKNSLAREEAQLTGTEGKVQDSGHEMVTTDKH